MSPPVATPTLSPVDTTVRNALELKSKTARDVVNQGTNVLAGLSAAAPTAMNFAYALRLQVGLDEHGNPVEVHDIKGALGRELIDGTTQLVSTGLNIAIKDGFQGTPISQRPPIDGCLTDPKSTWCTTGFDSGHTTQPATAFGIGLAHFAYDKRNPTPVYQLALLGGATLAMAWGREAGGDHTFTQVGTAALLSTGVGFLVPSIFQWAGYGYDHWDDARLKRADQGLVALPYVTATDNSLSVGFTGTFP
jgi:hypothetical protein